MDRLVKADVKEVEIGFKKRQKCSSTFRITNLMHTMSVAISLSTTNPSIYSFSQPFSIIPPLSSSSYTLILSQPSDEPPPLAAPPDVITVKSSMLPTGKAHQDDLRRLFSRPGPHVFSDAIIPIKFVGPQVVEFLIDNHTRVPDLNSFFNNAISGCTASQLTSLLEYTVMSGNPKLVSCLIDYGADVNHKDVNGRSMISLAVKSGSIGVVKLLIVSGCTIERKLDQVLHNAAAINRADIMEVLCTKFGDTIDVNSVNEEGRTPIHIAAIHNHVEVIKFCVSIGGKTDALDSNGWSALHLASEKGHKEAVECLLNHSNFGKYQVNKQGKTAFAVAVENGHLDLYDMLQLGDVLHRAARVDDVRGIRNCLAEGATVNGRDQNGWTPLHRAAFKGRIECVKALLSKGALVDVVGDAGFTPLHCAVEAGHVQVALLLIAHGANIKTLKGVFPWNLDSFKSHPSPLYREKSKQLEWHIKGMMNTS